MNEGRVRLLWHAGDERRLARERRAGCDARRENLRQRASRVAAGSLTPGTPQGPQMRAFVLGQPMVSF